MRHTVVFTYRYMCTKACVYSHCTSTNQHVDMVVHIPTSIILLLSSYGSVGMIPKCTNANSIDSAYSTVLCIRESEDSLCRDGADTPIKPNVAAQNSRTQQL